LDTKPKQQLRFLLFNRSVCVYSTILLHAGKTILISQIITHKKC